MNQHQQYLFGLKSIITEWGTILALLATIVLVFPSYIYIIILSLALLVNSDTTQPIFMRVQLNIMTEGRRVLAFVAIEACT